MISSNSFPTSSAASLKNFSVGEFFKVSLEQYLLLRCSFLHQALEETSKSSDKRQQTLEFLNEFMQFGKLVTARPLKHCLTTIADIIERNIILDFSMLRKRGEELSRDVQNRSFKSLLLSFDKMDMHLVQLFARLLCIRLMYERLSQAQKVPKGANYRDKFDNDLSKHIDQIKILSSMSGDSNTRNKEQPSGEDLILQVIKSVLNGCISIELYSFLVSLSNRCELVETKKYIKSEYQALRDRFSKSQKSSLLEGQGITENIGEEHSKPLQQQQQQCSVGFETSCNNISNTNNELQQNKNDNSQANEMTSEDRNNNNNNSTFHTPKQDQLLTPFQSNSKQEESDKTFLTGSARRRLFTQIFVKKNGDPIIPMKQQQPLMSLSENNVNRRENSKLSCLQRDSSHSRLIEEENSNNVNSISEVKNNNNSIVNMNNTNNNNENNRHSSNNANNGFGSAHLEENTQFTLLNFKASQQQQHQSSQQSQQQQLNGSCNNIINNNNNMSNVFLNGRSSLDFRNQKITRSLIFSSQESEKLPNKSIELISQSQSQTDDFKRLSLASKPSSSSNSTTANIGSTTSALSKALCTSNLRQLTKPIQSGRTMYSQMNKKVLRNSQPKVHHGSSKHNNCTNANNNNNSQKKNNNNNGGEILNNKHNKDTNNILLEAAQLLLLEQDSRKQNQLKLMGRESAHQHDEHLLFNPSSITKKLQNDNGFSDGMPNKEVHNSLSEEETSLPLMYMWGHN